MEKQVIFRDRQELQAADLNNVQGFIDETVQHVITDAITNERQIVGLQVTEKSATEIYIAPGRLWAGDEGKIYRLIEQLTVSLFSYIPISDKKYLAVSVYGQETETDVQPRDFLIDLQTGQTEPRAVAMENRREIVTHITAGLESTDPQKPAAPTGYTVIAYVLLDASGIDTIELAENKRLNRLLDVNTRLAGVEDWKGIAGPKISTLSSDIAAIGMRVDQMSKDNMNRRVNEMAADIARVKDNLNLPDTYGSYSKDNFLNAEKSDTEDAEYYARTEEGLSFPFAAEDESQIALFNPYEAAVQAGYKDIGFLLPAFTEEARLRTTGYAGDLSISQYQSQTFEVKAGITPVTVIRYGPTRWVPTWWLRSEYWRNYYCYYYYNWLYGENCTSQYPEGYEVLETNGYWSKIRGFWKDTVNMPYQFIDTVDQNINGSLIAQTFLNSQNGWLTKIGLYLTQIGTDGSVNLLLTETDRGIPDLAKTVANTSLNASSLKQYPLETVFTFSKPAYLQAGKRYALVLITTGSHKVAVVSGTEYTQGTIFYSTDQEYYQADYTKDLMMNFYFAKFLNPRIEVILASASLSGGIADIGILAQMIVPETCEMFFEYQKDGKWYPINESTTSQLLGLPALLPIRAVFVGSTDLMPCLVLTDSKLQVRRPATTFKHFSTVRSVSPATDHVDVQVLLRDFDAAKHACTIKLRKADDTLITATSVTDVVEEDGVRRTAAFDGMDPAISEYDIVIEGTSTTALEIFHIGERIDIAQ